MKEAARDCGGRGLMQIQLWEGAVLRSAQTRETDVEQAEARKEFEFEESFHAASGGERS